MYTSFYKRMQTSDTFFKEAPVETYQEQSTCMQIQCRSLA